MTIADAYLAELTHEAAITRAILQVVPLDKGDYKPHDKSMSLIGLTGHVAELPSWITMTVKQDGLDFATMKYEPFLPKTTEELLAGYDKMVEEAKAALVGVSDETMMKPWTLQTGETIHFTMPKAATVRSFALSHLIHHRAQLGVYLRMLDVALPGTYGPSADTKM